MTDLLDVSVLKQGVNFGAGGVSCTYHQAIPDLLSSTTSESGEFAWKWLMMGKLVLVTGEHGTSFEGGLVVGIAGQRFHAVALPESNSNEPVYVSSMVSNLEVTPHFKKSFLGKSKLTGLKIAIGESFIFGALVVDELLSRGTATPHGERTFLPAMGISANG